MELNITVLLKLIEEMPAYNRLVDEIISKDSNPRVMILDAAKPYLVAALYHRLQIPMLLVTSRPENSKKIYEQLTNWSGPDRIVLYPEIDYVYYERISSDNTSEVERLKVLSSLAINNNVTDEKDEVTPLIVTSALALMQKVPPRDDFIDACRIIKLGMEIEPLHLVSMCLDMGYRLENIVEIPGIISRRGGIVDIFPPTNEQPVRLEFFGNTIDSIRYFDPSSQRSLNSTDSVLITPATEIFTPFMYEKVRLEEILNNVDLTDCPPELREQFEKDFTMLLDKQKPDNIQLYAPLFNKDNLLDYLSVESLLIIDEPQSVITTIEDHETRDKELRNEAISRGELPTGLPGPNLSWEEFEPLINRHRRLTFSVLGIDDEKQRYELDFTPAPKYAGQITSFIKKTSGMLQEKKRIILISHQANRLSELLAEEDIIAAPVNEVTQLPPPGSLTLIQGLMDEGWNMSGNTYLLTDAELFGFIKQRRLMKKQPVSHQRIGVDVNVGDYVVHVEHGIARFAGVTRLNTEGGEKEYLVLLYDAGDRLYVPTDQIDRVNRYIGAGERTPVLSRLGTQEWARNKQRVKEAIADIAEELLALYAAREVAPGFKFSPDTVWQHEVEASFPYVETPDQIEVQKQIKEDMEKSKPMDRLVCGDVGYGKTEVALRAAFKAIMDGKQVAVLVPTTVLAEQHYSTFSQRLAAFPVKIEVLSRFRSNREQQVILEGLSNGSVDICIGTHRLIQKDVVFKELGLLIIDEEQRFGVVHKEYFKKKRQEVDVLTLSATPIPRTLHMSLVGVRDMSVMETPPEARLPVKTYVAEYNERLIREAVIREMERNGQVFFVHNRVQSIGYMAGKLQALIPEAMIAIGHGQMHEMELEKTMMDFVQGNSDILVCSSIIQSGLDMPNVNTLIVNQSDKFGLTQLYQLRGRVGRGANLAYAYFLYDKGKRLTPVAETRLRTIFEATELGAGFNIAMKDLEIRGAGTLLGVKQSGHISAVGFNLYCQLLAQAVEEQKAKQAGIPVEASSLLPPPTVDLPLPAYIPEDYIPDLDTRLALYNKLVKLDEVEQIESIAKEFRDRFGMLPQEIKNLLYAVKVKLLAAEAGITAISTEQNEIVLRLFEGMRFNKQKVDPVLKDGVKYHPFHLRFNVRRLGKNWQLVLEEVLKSII